MTTRSLPFYLNVLVTPNVKKEALIWDGEKLRVRVLEKPEKGKANQAVISLISDKVKIPKRNITIVSGETSRNKRLLFCKEDWEKLLSFLLQIKKD